MSDFVALLVGIGLGALTAEALGRSFAPRESLLLTLWDSTLGALLAWIGRGRR